MRTIKTSLLLLLAVLLAGVCFTAQADETGCRAVITLLSGEKITVRQFSVRLLEDAAPSTELLVFYDDGQSIMDVRKLLRLTRPAPPKEAKVGEKVEFAFKDVDGQTGRFQIWADYLFSGRIEEGAWSEQAANIKQIVMNCPAVASSLPLPPTQP